MVTIGDFYVIKEICANQKPGKMPRGSHFLAAKISNYNLTQRNYEFETFARLETRASFANVNKDQNLTFHVEVKGETYKL